MWHVSSHPSITAKNEPEEPVVTTKEEPAKEKAVVKKLTAKEKALQAKHQFFTLGRRMSHAPTEHLPYDERCCHIPDLGFAILFVGCAAVMAYYGIAIGINKVIMNNLDCEGLQKAQEEAAANGSGQEAMDDFQVSLCSEYGPGMAQNAMGTYAGYISMFNIFYLSAVICLLLCLVWIRILLCCGAFLMKAICILASAGLMGASMYSVQKGYTNAQYIMAPIAMVIILYYAFNHHRIEFAGATLECACKVILSHPNILTVKLLTVILQLGWIFLFAAACVGLYVQNQAEHAHEKPMGENQYMYEWGGLVLVFFWGQQAYEGVVICTVAQVTTSWWFNKEGSEAMGATFRAYRRAWCCSFGSIAFGALLVAVIETIEAYFVFLQKQCTSDAAKRVLKIIACLIHCVRKCAEYLTAYAYVYIGVHGYNFLTAGYKVMQLFVHHGMTAASNDAMVMIILGLANVAMGLFMAGVGLGLMIHNPNWVEGVETPERLVCGVCFVIGFGICSIFLASIKAANKAIFICWLENPHALERAKPEEHKKLKKKAEAIGLKEREIDLDDPEAAHTHVSGCGPCCMSHEGRPESIKSKGSGHINPNDPNKGGGAPAEVITDGEIAPPTVEIATVERV